MLNIRKCISTVLLLAVSLLLDKAIANEGQCVSKERVVTQVQLDELFAQPYVDEDEWRDEPVRHRYVHGGFRNTETRFSYYFPVKEQYEGHFFQYITPVPINEFISQGRSGEEDMIGFSIDSGAYFIETNGGGKALTGRPGVQVDPTIAAYRANAAAAQYSRLVAMDMYGCQRPLGYAYGGSGGAYRTAGGVENTEGVWDGAVPFVIGSPMAIPNVFTVRSYALRVLKHKLAAIADAVDVGSDIDPYSLLNEEEAAAFREVSAMGFPVEAWYVHDKLDLHGFAVLFSGVMAADPGYFSEDFWEKPGYEGFAQPKSLEDAKIEHRTSITAVVMAADADKSELRSTLEKEVFRGLADDAFKELLSSGSSEVPVAIELASVPEGDLLGADVLIRSGAAAGQRLLLTNLLVGNHFIPDSRAVDLLSSLKVGDELEINNLNFLASQTYHRHQVPTEGYPVWDQFRDEKGKPVYPQRPMLLGPLFTAAAAGTSITGRFNGKMIVLSNLYDTEAYPWQGHWYRQQAEAHLGAEINKHFRLWYTDHANHGDRSEQISPTHTVSFLGVLQQALRDLSAWVERGVEPAPSSSYQIVDGQVRLPSGAAARGGIQPFIQLLANGVARANVSVGEVVQLTANVQIPESTGDIVEAYWDLDGTGSFTVPAKWEQGTTGVVSAKRDYAFNAPGTHFVTLRVGSHRESKADTPYAVVRNLARVRVVVR